MRIKWIGLALGAFCLAACDSISMTDQTSEVLMFRPSDGKYALCTGSAGPSLPPFDQSMPAGVTACVKQCKDVGFIEQGVRPADAVMEKARQTSCSMRTGG